MIPGKIAFVDIETTGVSSYFDRIIEIGILLSEDGRLTDSFQTLINPEAALPPFIENLTGISRSELENAPTFSQVKDKILNLLENRVFAAHNARFDYSFIRDSLKKHGVNYSAKQLCTVKLFRALQPGLAKYNLDHLITHYHLKISRRHRAFDDAKALFDFYNKARKTYSPQTFEDAIDKVLKHITTPINISQEDLDSLPESPGVYIFWSDSNIPLYVGKSISIKDRVLSHFADSAGSPKELGISQQIKRIDTYETAGELSALLLESTYVKRYQPLYNRQLRHVQKMLVATFSKSSSGYYTSKLEMLDAVNPDTLDNIIGIFRSEKQAKDTLSIIAKENHLCPVLLGLEKSKTACFSYQLGQCRGACVGKESSTAYNMRFLTAFSKYRIKRWPFAGPIIIKEGNRDKFESVIVDKWCILGSGSWDKDDNLDIKSSPYNFDLDAYKILTRFLSIPSNIRKIKILDYRPEEAFADLP